MPSAVDRLRALPARAKVAFVAALLAIAGAAWLVTAAQRDARIPLFTQALHAEQVAEVALRLAEWNVPFVATADNVRVDPSRRNELLAKLSLAGIPHDHVPTSDDILEKASPLTPPSALDAARRGAQAGDIELALRGLGGIEDARVIVAPSEANPFADERGHGPSVAVRLSVRPGAALKPEVVHGIRAFVASAVGGVDPKAVVVLDDRGVVSGDGAEESSGGNALEQSLQSALDAAFGSGSTIVRVRVTPDARVRELHDVRREPLDGKAIAVARIDERYTSEKKHYAKVHSGEDRGSIVHEEHTQVPPGAAVTISAAVIADAARGIDVVKLRAIAGAALGLVPERGDTLSVESIAFAHAVVPGPRSRAAVVLGYAAATAPSIVLAAALLVALKLAIGPVLTTVERLDLRRSLRPDAHAAPAPERLREALRGEPPHVAAAVLRSLPASTATAVLALYPEPQRAEIVKRLAREGAPVVAGMESLLNRA